MGIKRKRSVITLSPASSSSQSTLATDHGSSWSPSPFCPHAPLLQDISMGDSSAGDIDCRNGNDYCNYSIPTIMEMYPKHLHSRTRKRVRDGRPDEDVIHGIYMHMLPFQVFPVNLDSLPEQTLHKLFSAQKQQSHSHAQSHLPITDTPTQSYPRPPSSVSSQSSHTGRHASQQPSLHAYFTSSLPHRSSHPPPPPFQHPSHYQPVLEHPKCEDCDRPLHNPDRMTGLDAMDMDVDQVDEAACFGCLECGRRVCDTCSIRDGGGKRLCLGCAEGGSGKRWVGGIGWM